MISYSKSYLDTLAQEHGFIRDNLEKVMRLGRILSFIHNDPLLGPSLVLKGSKAINLVVFAMPLLSADIDLDYAINSPREEMLAQREAGWRHPHAIYGKRGIRGSTSLQESPLA